MSYENTVQKFYEIYPVRASRVELMLKILLEEPLNIKSIYKELGSEITSLDVTRQLVNSPRKEGIIEMYGSKRNAVWSIVSIT